MRQVVATSPPRGRDRSGRTERASAVPVPCRDGQAAVLKAIAATLRSPSAVASSTANTDSSPDFMSRHERRMRSRPRPGDGEKPHRLTYSRDSSG